MDVAGIRAALAAAAATVTPPTGYLALSAYAFQPGAIAAPAVYPTETDGVYDETVDGAGSLAVTLRVLTSRSEEEAGQQYLDALLVDSGAGSLKVAIEADPTLGGLVDDVHVRDFAGYRTYDHGANSYWGAELTVLVMA